MSEFSIDTLPSRYIPTEEEFKAAITEFGRSEPRGPVYFDACREIEAGWGDVAAMARGIGLLLTSWHKVFYRFGLYDERRLMGAVEKAMPVLEAFRGGDIGRFGAADETAVSLLFGDFTRALRDGRGGKQESTVATAKALHLLARDYCRFGTIRLPGHTSSFQCSQATTLDSATKCSKWH